MRSEKRGIKYGIFFAIFAIVLNIIINVKYFRYGGSAESIESVYILNKFTAFFVIISCIFNFFEKRRKLTEEEKIALNKKMYRMKVLSIVFIGYVIFAVFIVRHESVIISALIMCAGYINWYMLKSKSRSEVNLLWKIKPMLVPHVSISFNERIKYSGLSIVFLSFALLMGVLLNDPTEMHIRMLVILVILIGFPYILFLVEAIFGLFTKTEGICTRIVIREGGVKEPVSYGSVYYEVYVTDFAKKREVNFIEKYRCKYKEGDVVNVIHGGLTKSVIKAKIVKRR